MQVFTSFKNEFAHIRYSIRDADRFDFGVSSEYLVANDSDFSTAVVIWNDNVFASCKVRSTRYEK